MYISGKCHKTMYKSMIIKLASAPHRTITIFPSNQTQKSFNAILSCTYLQHYPHRLQVNRKHNQNNTFIRKKISKLYINPQCYCSQICENIFVAVSYLVCTAQHIEPYQIQNLFLPKLYCAGFCSWLAAECATNVLFRVHTHLVSKF